MFQKASSVQDLKDPQSNTHHTSSSSTSTRSLSEAHKSCPAWGANMETHSYSCWLMFYRFYHGGQSSWVICVIAAGKGTTEAGGHSGGAACSECGTRSRVRELRPLLASAGFCVCFVQTCKFSLINKKDPLTYSQTLLHRRAGLCLPLPYTSHFLTHTLLISEVWLMGFIVFMFPGRDLASS